MTGKLRVDRVILVEGRYDATALATQVEGLILTTDGYSIFSNEEKKALIRRLGRQRGLLILTDSDAAGFRIRHYIEKIATGCDIRHAYIPAVAGKESRKALPSAEGTLGVEGMPPATLRLALERAGVTAGHAQKNSLTYTHLYELGISGGPGSAERRRALLHRAGLPQRLSKKALLEVLDSLYSYEELKQLANQTKHDTAGKTEQPVLFWDFHGTLTLPEVTWYEVALEAAAEQMPHRPLTREVLEQHFSQTCLPWWTVPGRDTRHLAGSEAWWGHCEREFEGMFQNCGFTPEEAEQLAPILREKSLEPARYTLYPDAVPTLEALRERGYKSYILSNNFPELAQIVEALGIRHLFEGLIVSGLVGYDKPHPGIFAAAREMADGPQNPWMVGDNPHDDIAGAKAAGFTTVAAHGTKSPDADYEIGDLAEILHILPGGEGEGA